MSTKYLKTFGFRQNVEACEVALGLTIQTMSSSDLLVFLCSPKGVLMAGCLGDGVLVTLPT